MCLTVVLNWLVSLRPLASRCFNKSYPSSNYLSMNSTVTDICVNHTARIMFTIRFYSIMTRGQPVVPISVSMISLALGQPFDRLITPEIWMNTIRIFTMNYWAKQKTYRNYIPIEYNENNDKSLSAECVLSNLRFTWYRGGMEIRINISII